MDGGFIRREGGIYIGGRGFRIFRVFGRVFFYLDSYLL